MAYIGNIPAESYASFETETFSVSATANYTLSHAVTNENEIRLVINGVVQQPGSGKAYTASGTTLTLTSATVSGDSMYAVYLGRALQTVNPPNASVGSAQIADSLISGKTALGATPADTDELLISDAGTLKKVDYSYLKVANTPAFEAFRSGSAQTISQGTTTKIEFQTEIFDTAGAYDSSTNYRFTIPSNQAGKYFVYSQIWMQAQSSTTFRDCQLTIRKNGSDYKRVYWYFNNNPIRWIIPNVTATMDLSVGDYIEMFIYTETTDSATTSVTHNASQPLSNFGAYKLIGV